MKIRQQQGEIKDVHDSRKSKLRKGLRKALNELLERRLEADYREEEIFDRRTVQMAIGEAKNAVNYLAQLCK